MSYSEFRRQWERDMQELQSMRSTVQQVAFSEYRDMMLMRIMFELHGDLDSMAISLRELAKSVRPGGSEQQR